MAFALPRGKSRIAKAKKRPARQVDGLLGEACSGGVLAALYCLHRPWQLDRRQVRAAALSGDGVKQYTSLDWQGWQLDEYGDLGPPRGPVIGMSVFF